MSVIRAEHPQIAEKLFQGWEETLIWSCLQGIMGELYVMDEVCPKSAMIVQGDFVFFAGEPCEELIRFVPEHKKRPCFQILTPRNQE